jgi:hypothetical protein
MPPTRPYWQILLPAKALDPKLIEQSFHLKYQDVIAPIDALMAKGPAEAAPEAYPGPVSSIKHMPRRAILRMRHCPKDRQSPIACLLMKTKG